MTFARKSYLWKLRTRELALGGRTLVMGVLNVTPDSFSDGVVSPAAARWDPKLGLYVIDWDDARASDDPRATALEFAHSVFAHACTVCEWDLELAASVNGTPPPVV